MNISKTCQRIAWVLLIALAACNHPQKPVQKQQAHPISKPADTSVKADTTATIDTTLPASKQADTTAKTAAPAADQAALTLPILDALFYEPDFTKELKAKLHLPARKIAELRTAAH